MKKRAILAALAVSVFATQGVAEVHAKLGTFACFQGQTRSDYGGNLELGYVRAELYSNVTSDDKSIDAFVRLRMQNLMGDGSRGQPNDQFQVINAQFRFQPVNEYLQFQIGRWEETYKERALYFGRYAIQDPGKTGSGSFLTQEVLMDMGEVISEFGGDFKNRVAIGVMPRGGVDTLKDGTTKSWSNYNDINLYTRWSGALIESKLRLDVVGNFAVARENDAISKNSQSKMSFNAEWDITKDLSLRGELGLTNLDKVSENTWGCIGVDIPTGGILDLLAFDLEIHKNRVNGSWLNPDNNGTDFDSNIGWFVDFAKVFKKVIRWDIGFGVDPSGDGVGSQNSGDIGMISRIGLRF